MSEHSSKDERSFEQERGEATGCEVGLDSIVTEGDVVPASLPEHEQGEPLPGSDRQDQAAESEEFKPVRSARPRRGKRMVKKTDPRQVQYTPEQRLLILDTWMRSGLPAPDFCPLVGVSAPTLYKWRKDFAEHGPEGLMPRPRGRKGSRLPEVTKRTIVMIKQAHPEYGSQRISDMLLRGPGLSASPNAVVRVLREAGYETREEVRQPHAPVVRRFERARPKELWQVDIFTFTLKRQNRRVHLMGYLDDYSRFIVGYGLFGSATTAAAKEVLLQAIASYGPPVELLTDNGPQFVTWRGKSAFSKELEKLGIRQVVSRPRHPQTLGKVERFWGSLWRECLQEAIFVDFEDALRRVGLYIDHYNFHRPHQGIDSAVPADRFFEAAPQVLASLKTRASENALEQSRTTPRRPPFYLTGQVDGRTFSVHAAGKRVFMTREGEGRKEVELSPAGGEEAAESAALPEPVTQGAGPVPGDMDCQEPAPGVSPLIEGLKQLDESLAEGGDVTAEAEEGGDE